MGAVAVRQPIPAGPVATSDANGTATFTVDRLPTGTTMIGTLSVPGAPASATFTAIVNLQPLGQFQGLNTFGPVTVAEGESLTVTAVGLVPLTQYQLTWAGTSYTGVIPPDSAPATHPSTVTAVYQRRRTGITVGIPNETIPLLPGDQTLIIVFTLIGIATGNAYTYSIVGQQSGYVYANTSIQCSTLSNQTVTPPIQLFPSIDSVLVVNMTVTSGSAVASFIFDSEPIVPVSPAVPFPVSVVTEGPAGAPALQFPLSVFRVGGRTQVRNASILAGTTVLIPVANAPLVAFHSATWIPAGATPATIRFTTSGDPLCQFAGQGTLMLDGLCHGADGVSIQTTGAGEIILNYDVMATAPVIQ